MKIKLDDFLTEYLKQAAENCNCTVQDVITNVLYARFAEYATRAEVYGDPQKGIVPELIIRDGKLLYTGKEVAVFIRVITKAEQEQIKKLLEINNEIENNILINSNYGNA